MSWFESVKVPTNDLDGVIGCNYEYIDKSYARVSQLFNNTCLIRYLRPRKVMVENGSEFKLDFNPLLKDPDIDHFLTNI